MGLLGNSELMFMPIYDLNKVYLGRIDIRK